MDPLKIVFVGGAFPDEPMLITLRALLWLPGLTVSMVPAAEPYSVARLCLEEVVPAAAEDARRVVKLLAEAAGRAVVPDFEAL